MSARLLPIGLLFGLTACAQQLVWVKQGAGQNEFAEIRYKCLQQSTQQVPVHEVVTAIDTSGLVYHADANLGARDNLFAACMQAAGWRVVRQQDYLAQQQAQAAPRPAPVPSTAAPVSTPVSAPVANTVPPGAQADSRDIDRVCYSAQLDIIYHAGACWNQDREASAAQLDQFHNRFKAWSAQPLAAGVPRKVPASGTRVYNTIGGFREYIGTEGPLEVLKGAERQVFSSVGGFQTVDAATTQLPLDAMAAFWPLRIGHAVSFDYTNKSGHFDVTLKAVRRETVKVPAGSFDAFVIERHAKGRAPNYFESVTTFWLAVREGVLVKEDFKLLAGNSAVKPWEALSIAGPDARTTVVASQPPPAPPAPAVTPVRATGGVPRSVALEQQGGTYVVPVLVNHAITLKFTVDSGASDVSIPADVFTTLIRAGTIVESDLQEKLTYTLADGSKVQSQRFRLRSLTVGDLELTNVTGSVAPAKGALLLGQSFLGRLSSWSIDNGRHALVIN